MVPQDHCQKLLLQLGGSAAAVDVAAAVDAAAAEPVSEAKCILTLSVVQLPTLMQL
jgi:hypothetical protein